jgi:hypothetical protein
MGIRRRVGEVLSIARPSGQSATKNEGLQPAGATCGPGELQPRARAAAGVRAENPGAWGRGRMGPHAAWCRIMGPHHQRRDPQITVPPSERRGWPDTRHFALRALELGSKSVVSSSLNYLLFVAATAVCQGTKNRVFASEPAQTHHARTTTHYWHHTDQCYSLGVHWWRLGSRLQLRSSRGGWNGPRTPPKRRSAAGTALGSRLVHQESGIRGGPW